jgi:hypothetical protein
MDSDVFIDTDDVNEAEKDFIRNCIYRQDLLNIFKLDMFDEIVINKKINKIYDKSKSHEEFNKCIIKVAELIGVDPKFGFIILYSFDHLYLTHMCVCELLETGNISLDKINNLQKNIS